jgi:hypothetical protein
MFCKIGRSPHVVCCAAMLDFFHQCYETIRNKIQRYTNILFVQFEGFAAHAIDKVRIDAR